ncbi:MAG: restriction endonuclease [Gammaproteobacteria bacterium]|nr:restriction endonuclease [Gammaproteobacteria bacterium]
MTIVRTFQGTLFAEEFLFEFIRDMPEWGNIGDTELDKVENNLRNLFTKFPAKASPNESQTENDLIWPVLRILGWKASLRQQNLSLRGREDVPDGLLFKDNVTKDLANTFHEEWKRYRIGSAIVECKRWARPLDRRSGRSGEETAPSTQLLRYLRRVDDLSEGGVRWGILTNGQCWRLYWQGAHSVSDQFFEVDLATMLALPEYQENQQALNLDARRHLLKVFFIIFRPGAFLPDPIDGRTLHQRAVDESRYHQQHVSSSLSELVFGQVFPNLAYAISEASPAATCSEVRKATLILLYRLLFIFFAEDRDLLPVRDTRYGQYGLREKVRIDVGHRKDKGDVFSSRASRYWSVFDDLCRTIDIGDRSIGLPPYNGGLFDRTQTPLLSQIRLADSVMASMIDALGFEQLPNGRRYINYRDLGVQQFGSIYERLLEQEIVRNGNQLILRPNVFARKNSGSYYTPDDLVGLIVRETINPLIQSCLDSFQTEAENLVKSHLPEDIRIGQLKIHDPAERILELRVCDPAMGSGHFLVYLVDYLTDRIITAMAESEDIWKGYLSPLSERVDKIRNKIINNAKKQDWLVDPSQLDDRHIIRRMVLKRCVYGVDKNPMAVELAKVSLWLHTFTVGAPLSFIDHHLRCGDSLFGTWVRVALDESERKGGRLLVTDSVKRAVRAATPMQILEKLTDAEIAEAYRSSDIFDEVSIMTAPLDALMSLLFAFEWMDLRNAQDKAAVQEWLMGTYGDPVTIALATTEIRGESKTSHRFRQLLEKARQLIAEERFLNWQVMFPGVWDNWEDSELQGGFDAVIGNPPWDRMKLQQVEWFEFRRPEIAQMTRASDRTKLIKRLEQSNDPLAEEFALASVRATSSMRMIQTRGDYPLLSHGDVNLYALFVERAMTLVKADGMIGLLTPIGIGTDKSAAPLFAKLMKKRQLKCFCAFENRRGWLFPGIHHEEQPTAIVFSHSQGQFNSYKYCARISDWLQFQDSERCFHVDSTDAMRINPNTGTAPLFRNRRDANLITAIYERLPVLVDRSTDEVIKAWAVKYMTMFHMTNDSKLFRTRMELEETEGAWPTGKNRFDSPSGKWLPLYEGKSIQLFNHRYASVKTNPKSISSQGNTEVLTFKQLSDINLTPEPRYWVNKNNMPCLSVDWGIGFNSICNINNARSLITSIVPLSACANSLPIFLPENSSQQQPIELLAANLGSIICDYVARQKIQSRNLNKYIIEQLPVIPVDAYHKTHFGSISAGELLRQIILELTYTATDIAAFARSMGYVSNKDEVLPPFKWDEKRRLLLRSKLDAIYFHLYGITKRDDIRYVYSTFPVIERQEIKLIGSFRSRDLCLAWFNALSAGEPDATITI